jgi:large subunit ribosomal protein L30
MAQLKITLTHSPIDKTKRQKDTIKSLGFRKMNQVITRDQNPQLLGMLAVVSHLVKVEPA